MQYVYEVNTVGFEGALFTFDGYKALLDTMNDEERLEHTVKKVLLSSIKDNRDVFHFYRDHPKSLQWEIMDKANVSHLTSHLRLVK